MVEKDAIFLVYMYIFSENKYWLENCFWSTFTIGSLL